MGRRIVGLDIGYLHLRAVALEAVKSGYRVVGHAQVSRFDDLGQRKALPRALNEIDSRLRLRGKVVVASSELASMVRFEHNDPMPPDRLDRVLRLELSQHAGGEGDIAADAVPIPLDGDELIHCCGLAQPPQVLELLAELRQNGVEADRVDLAAAAGANALRYQELSEAEERQFGLVIDIGARSTRVCLMRGRDFLACRQLAYGGDNFSEELARARELRFEDAERVKTGLATAETLAADDQPGGSEPDVDFIGVRPEDLLSARSAASGDSDRLALVDEEDSSDSDRLALVDEEAVSDRDRLALVDEEEAVSDRDRLTLVDEEEAPQGLAADHDRLALKDETGRIEVFEDAAPSAGAGDADDSQSWRRSDGFDLDEPEVSQPGSQTLQMGDVAMGPELTRSAENLYAQVVKTVAWFQAQLRLNKLDVEWVRLAGGGSDLIGLTAYLRRRFNAPVSVLNPFGQLSDRPPMAPQGFTLAMGLALSDHPQAVSFDLRPESLQRKSLFWGEVLWPRVAAGLLLAATVLIAVAMWLNQSADQQRFERYDQQRQQHEALIAQRKALIAQRDGMLTDLKGIASRIFGGRDLLYSIRAFKQEAPKELWITDLSTSDLRLRDRSAGSSGRAGTRGRGERGSASVRGGDTRTASAEVREDTLIDTVYIKGFVRPDAGNTTTDLYGIFVRWYERLVDWQAEETGGALFSTHTVREFDDRREAADAKGRYSFDIVFRLRPTTWSEVAQLMGGDGAQP